MSTPRRISEPKGFQRVTAEVALVTLTRKDGPRRFLVADEVGLGKTVVARTIISEMMKRRRRPLVVFYVSSNLNIAHQNQLVLSGYAALRFFSIFMWQVQHLTSHLSISDCNASML